MGKHSGPQYQQGPCGEAQGTSFQPLPPQQGRHSHSQSGLTAPMSYHPLFWGILRAWAVKAFPPVPTLQGRSCISTVHLGTITPQWAQVPQVQVDYGHLSALVKLGKKPAETSGSDVNHEHSTNSQHTDIRHAGLTAKCPGNERVLISLGHFFLYFFNLKIVRMENFLLTWKFLWSSFYSSSSGF